MNSQIKSTTIGEMIDCYASKDNIFSTTSDYTLRAVPALSAEYEAQAEGIITQFTGDPSFMAYNGAEAEEPADPDDPDAPPPKEMFREVHRLTYIIQVYRTYWNLTFT